MVLTHSSDHIKENYFALERAVVPPLSMLGWNPGGACMTLYASIENNEAISLPKDITEFKGYLMKILPVSKHYDSYYLISDGPMDSAHAYYIRVRRLDITKSII